MPRGASSSSYFEIAVRTGDVNIVDLSKYAAGRSGRDTPSSLKLILQSYRYRPRTAVCALFSPRLVVNADGIYDRADNPVEDEAGVRRAGAVLGFSARTGDSTSSCVDSVLAGYTFNIPLRGGTWPPSIDVSVADGAVTPQVIGYAVDDSTGAPNRTFPVRAEGEVAFANRMFNAIKLRNAEKLNAIQIPIVISKKVFNPTSATSEAVEAQIYGEDPEIDADFFLASHHHEIFSIGARPTPSKDERFKRTGLYIARESTAYDPQKGTLVYAFAFASESNSWTSEMLQKGQGLSFFYVGLQAPDRKEVIQRIDLLVGRVRTDPPVSIFKPSLTPYITVWECQMLPLMEDLVHPDTATGSIAATGYALPIRRQENGVFSGTFSLEYVYGPD